MSDLFFFFFFLKRLTKVGSLAVLTTRLSREAQRGENYIKKKNRQCTEPRTAHMETEIAVKRLCRAGEKGLCVKFICRNSDGASILTDSGLSGNNLALDSRRRRRRRAGRKDLIIYCLQISTYYIKQAAATVTAPSGGERTIII